MIPLLAAALTLAAPPVDDFAARHRRAVAENPAGVTVAVRVGVGGFTQGQAIPVTLSFSSRNAGRYQLDGGLYDRVGRMHADELHLDPVDGLVDPLWDYFAGGVVGMGGIRSMPVLQAKPYEIRLDLAEWVRFDRPGRYRLYVRSFRVSDLRKTVKPGEGAPIVPVTSNAVDIVVTAADPNECARQVEAAAATLDRVPIREHDIGRERRDACRSLRYASCPQAMAERVRRRDELDPCTFEMVFGLYGAADRTNVVQEMETALTSPRTAIDSFFLDNLARLSQRAAHPVPRPAEPFGTVPADERSEADIRDEMRAVDAQRKRATQALAVALPGKQGRARAISLLTLLTQNDVDDAAALRPQLADVLAELPAERLNRLLEYEWPFIRDASLAPALRRVYESPAPNEWGQTEELRTLALRRWYEVAPAAARPVILDEMRQTDPRLDRRWIALLPDETLPEIDDPLVANFEKDRVRGDDEDRRGLLLARYATARVQGRVKALYETVAREPPLCGRAPLLAYLLRVDPEAADAKLRSLVAANKRNEVGCPDFLKKVARLQWSPVLERIAREQVEAADIDRATEAAEMLGRYASAEARVDLQKRLEAWQRQWQGKAADLEYDQRRQRTAAEKDARLGRALVQALVNGSGWFTGAEDLEALRGRCLTWDCRNQIDAAVAQRRGPMPVTIDRLGAFRMGGYELPTRAAFEAKLDQLPRGTTLLWQPDVLMAKLPDAEAMRRDVEASAGRRGLRLERLP